LAREPATLNLKNHRIWIMVTYH